MELSELRPKDGQQVFVCAISLKTQTNWDVCRSRSLWGFTQKAVGKASQVHPNSLLWFYVGGRGFVGLARATSKPRPLAVWEPSPWDDDREYGAILPVQFIADINPPVRLSFEKGYSVDARTGIHNNLLISGFFKIGPLQHETLLALAHLVRHPGSS
jgi:hypothetical protein